MSKGGSGEFPLFLLPSGSPACQTATHPHKKIHRESLVLRRLHFCPSPGHPPLEPLGPRTHQDQLLAPLSHLKPAVSSDPGLLRCLLKGGLLGCCHFLGGFQNPAACATPWWRHTVFCLVGLFCSFMLWTLGFSQASSSGRWGTELCQDGVKPAKQAAVDLCNPLSSTVLVLKLQRGGELTLG